jgi:hypothetical protein
MMTEEDKKLRRESWHAKYPWLHCDIECMTGWDDILDRLFALMHDRWQRMECHEDDKFSVMQVKEKFGTLRVYTGGADEMVHGMTAMAESCSSFTCEQCGANGARLTGKGWLSTRCTVCVPDAG